MINDLMDEVIAIFDQFVLQQTAINDDESFSLLPGLVADINEDIIDTVYRFFVSLDWVLLIVVLSASKNSSPSSLSTHV